MIYGATAQIGGCSCQSPALSGFQYPQLLSLGGASKGVEELPVARYRVIGAGKGGWLMIHQAE